MDIHLLIAKLHQRNLTLAGIGRKLGVSRQYISQVLYGQRESFRVEKAIADALGMRISEIFPVSVDKPVSPTNQAS